jgi:hypothetical protein
MILAGFMGHTVKRLVAVGLLAGSMVAVPLASATVVQADWYAGSSSGTMYGTNEWMNTATDMSNGNPFNWWSYTSLGASGTPNPSSWYWAQDENEIEVNGIATSLNIGSDTSLSVSGSGATRYYHYSLYWTRDVSQEGWNAQATGLWSNVQATDYSAVIPRAGGGKYYSQTWTVTKWW